MSTAEAQRAWRASRGARTGVRGRAPTAPCGTLAAHKRHVRHGEAPCDLCRLAARADRGFRRNRAGWAESEREAWLVHRIALDELLADPAGVAARIGLLVAAQRTGGVDRASGPRWESWTKLLDGPIIDLSSAMIGLGKEARQLRSSTPFEHLPDRRRSAGPGRDTARPTSRWRSSTPPANWCEHTGPAEGVVELPFHLYWSDENNRFDLSKRARVRSLYQIVLTEGSAKDVREYLNLALLLDVWDELWLSPAVHEAWDHWIAGRRRGAD